MKVEFYGRLAELAGGRTIDVPDPCADVSDVIRSIEGSQPLLAEALKSGVVRAVVDDAFVQFDTALRGTSKLAFVPPVSGG